MTKFVVNHDRYLSPTVEIYGFAERFSDSFVKIDQRYEIGVGAKYEKTWGGDFGSRSSKRETSGSGGSPQTDRILNWIEELESHVDVIAGLELVRTVAAGGTTAFEAQSVSDDFLENKPKCGPQAVKECADVLKQIDRCRSAYGAKGCAELLKLVSRRLAALAAERATGCKAVTVSVAAGGSHSVKAVDIGDVLEAFVKKYTRYEFGIAASAFAEFERPGSLTGTLIDTATLQEVAKNPTPESTQRFRLTIRPNFDWRIADWMTWKNDVYFKLPLDAPTRVEGELDYRIDAKSEMKWSLGGPSIVLRYEWRYDNVPPDRELQISLPPNQALTNAIPISKTHRLTSLNLEWKLQP